jgi:hypothetical protein
VVVGELKMLNPAGGILPPVTLPLVEQWRIGGDSDEEGEFFGVITDLTVNEQGDIYLLDRQLCEIMIFSDDGQYLRSIGREGEGPGEFRDPSSIFFMPDGQVGIVQTRPSALIQLLPDGEPGTTFIIPRADEGGMRRLDHGDCRGGNLTLSGMNFRRGEGSFTRIRLLGGIDAQGQLDPVYNRVEVVNDMARRVVREDDGSNTLWTMGPDGRVYASLDFEYRIRVWNRDGSLDRVIELDYEPIIRNRQAREKRKQEMITRSTRRGRHGVNVPDAAEVSDRERGIRWLQVDDEGRLWVLSGRGSRNLPDGELGVFQVYDPQGRFLQQVTLLGEGAIGDDRLIMAGTRLFVLTDYHSAFNAMRGREQTAEEEEAEELEEPEPMSVIAYQLNWPAP